MAPPWSQQFSRLPPCRGGGHQNTKVNWETKAVKCSDSGSGVVLVPVLAVAVLLRWGLLVLRCCGVGRCLKRQWMIHCS